MRFFPFVPLRVRMTVSVVLCLPDPYHGKSNAYCIKLVVDEGFVNNVSLKKRRMDGTLILPFLWENRHYRRRGKRDRIRGRVLDCMPLDLYGLP
jgi:hypothetical protein